MLVWAESLDAIPCKEPSLVLLHQKTRKWYPHGLASKVNYTSKSKPSEAQSHYNPWQHGGRSRSWKSIMFIRIHFDAKYTHNLWWIASSAAVQKCVWWSVPCRFTATYRSANLDEVILRCFWIACIRSRMLDGPRCLWAASSVQKGGNGAAPVSRARHRAFTRFSTMVEPRK